MSEAESHHADSSAEEVSPGPVVGIAALLYLLGGFTALAEVLFAWYLFSVVKKLISTSVDTPQKRRLVWVVIIGPLLGYLGGDWISDGTSVPTNWGTYSVGPRLVGASVGAIVCAAVAGLILLVGHVRSSLRVKRTPAPETGILAHHGAGPVQPQSERKASEEVSLASEEASLSDVLGNAASLVEHLQKRVPTWARFPNSEEGLCEIASVNGWRGLQDWYGSALKDILARAGASPLPLPLSAEFLKALEGGYGGPPFIWPTDEEGMRQQFQVEEKAKARWEDGLFTPREVLSRLVRLEGKLLEEDERLVKMEKALRDVERLWRREDLFVFGQLLRSVSPTAIARREARRQGLASAQGEFAWGLDQRNPGLGTAYRDHRNAYSEAMMVIERIEQSQAIDPNSKRYHPERLRDCLKFGVFVEVSG